MHTSPCMTQNCQNIDRFGSEIKHWIGDTVTCVFNATGLIIYIIMIIIQTQTFKALHIIKNIVHLKKFSIWSFKETIRKQSNLQHIKQCQNLHHQQKDVKVLRTADISLYQRQCTVQYSNLTAKLGKEVTKGEKIHNLKFTKTFKKLKLVVQTLALKHSLTYNI